MPQEIDLSGPNGNAFFLIGIASQAAKDLGDDPKEMETYLMESKDYDQLCDRFEERLGAYYTLKRLENEDWS